jgi:acylphosphatase
LWIVSFIAMKKITAFIKGRVQGVGYRYYVTNCAQEIGICGYVRNKEDGLVEVIGEGDENSLQEFIRQLHASEDSVIHVDDITVIWADSSREFKTFGIRW